jgi:hypothetical protein
MVALPAATPVTSPELFTVTTEVLSELQLTVLLVAFAGEIVAASCNVAFTAIVAGVGLILTLVTGVGALTVIVLVAILLPSCVVTVMVALPVATPVTSPVLLIVATDVLSELQLTVLLVASEGETVAVSCCISLTEIVADVALTVILVTAIVAELKSAKTE